MFVCQTPFNENNFLVVNRCIKHKASAKHGPSTLHWSIVIPNTCKTIKVYMLIGKTSMCESITFHNALEDLEDEDRSVYFEYIANMKNKGLLKPVYKKYIHGSDGFYYAEDDSYWNSCSEILTE